jgi:hypothetical protein
MAVKVKEWTQRNWRHPGVDLLRPSLDPGPEPAAFSTAYALAPDPYTGVLKRGPAWRAADTVPTGFDHVEGAFYDEYYQWYALVGRKTNDLYYIHDNSAFDSWSDPVYLQGSIDPGGQSGANVVLWGGYLWVIDNAGELWAATDYWNGLDKIYDTTALQVLGAMNDRLFAGDADGDVLRLNAGPSMGAYLSNVALLNPKFMAPFRQYLTVVCTGDDDSVHIHRLPDWQAHAFHQLGRLPCTPFPASNLGCPYALFEDKIWILTGQQAQSDGTFIIECYAFDGSQIRRAAVVTDLADYQTAVTCGLLVYNNRLLFHWGQVGKTYHHFHALVGDRFLPWAPLTGLNAEGSVKPFAAALSDFLICVSSDTDGTTPKIQVARRDQLQDGYVVTSRLDMGYPGRKKRLEQITVTLDGADADFDVKIYYRVDDASAWTLDTTAAGSRLAQALKIGAEFYLLQVRVDLVDGSGDDLDIGIEAVNVTYSVNE